MNSKDFEKLIKIAHESVKNEIEPYKLESYKLILDYLLHSSSNTSVTSSTSDVSSDQSIPKTSLPVSGTFENFAKSCNLSSSALKDVMTIKDKKIKITASIPGGEKLQRIIGSICVLLANEKVLCGEELSGSNVLSVLKSAGIYDNSGNLASNLEEYRKLFRISGTKSGKVYGLSSGFGIKTAQQIIEKLATGATDKEIKELLKPFKKN